MRLYACCDANLEEFFLLPFLFSSCTCVPFVILHYLNHNEKLLFDPFNFDSTQIHAYLRLDIATITTLYTEEKQTKAVSDYKSRWFLALIPLRMYLILVAGGSVASCSMPSSAAFDATPLPLVRPLVLLRHAAGTLLRRYSWLCRTRARSGQQA